MAVLAVPVLLALLQAVGLPADPNANLPTIAAPPAVPQKPERTSTGKGKRRPKVNKPLPLVLFHVNRRETLVLHPDAHYRFPAGSQRKFNRFMRCHHTNRQHAMSPRLMKVLAEISRHYEGVRLQIISGYRAPSAARNPKSPHKKGLASDIHVDGVANAELRDYCRRAFQKVGVGYYPNSSFVHVDVRAKVSAFWIDYSRPGEAPVYSRTPDEDLRTGRADTWKPWQSGQAVPLDGTGEGEGEGPPLEGGGPTPVGAAPAVPPLPLPTGAAPASAPAGPNKPPNSN